MILSTHAIVGAAIASFVPAHPAAAFVLGFASHFALDAIPHWDYPIRSASVNPKIGAPVSFDRALLRDALVIGSDGLVGVLLALFLFASSLSLWSILLGAVGAMLPDPLHTIDAHFPHEPLRTLQRFHRWIHTDKRMENISFWAVGSQIALVAIVVGLTAAVHHGIFAPALAKYPV
jgi:hypothetical protein